MVRGSPELRAVLPDAGVVVEGHGEMVRDEVLRGTPEVHGVPVLELRPVVRTQPQPPNTKEDDKHTQSKTMGTCG